MTSRAHLVQALAEARAGTDALFAMVRPDSFYERPVPERHRLIFYLGHLEAFDWNQLGQGTLDLKPFHPSFDQLFAFGIDPAAGQLPSDNASDWPLVEEVRGYNKRVRQTLDAVLAETPEPMLHVILEHRLMHAETFAYILHNMSSIRKIAPQTAPSRAVSAPVHTMIEIPAGTATLGRPRENGFGWDNEFDVRTVEVPSFAISKYKVTNGQYLEFVRAGGVPPHFWTRRGEQWCWRTMFGEIPLPLDWPVYVTWMQALDYAQWTGQAVPTEAQFHRAAYSTPTGEERLYPWGDEPPDERQGNFNFAHWDPLPVTATPRGDSAFGTSQLLGNGWEWTSTVFRPFPGFQPFPFYPGYSAPFFDGAHYVLKGASPRTAARLLRRSFRNWFRPNYPYVYATFRCVEN
ncbi:MAG TPA: SUMF1/EgtB/PvdO family nonheme iron enzyme [Gemmataceae bacterium]|nr:SUMF1/EgtB/PvdO family nonheme iron enzyme [Gemmataceae bacterium]